MDSQNRNNKCPVRRHFLEGPGSRSPGLTDTFVLGILLLTRSLPFLGPSSLLDSSFLRVPMAVLGAPSPWPSSQNCLSQNTSSEHLLLLSGGSSGQYQCSYLDPLRSFLSSLTIFTHSPSLLCCAFDSNYQHLKLFGNLPLVLPKPVQRALSPKCPGIYSLQLCPWHSMLASLRSVTYMAEVPCRTLPKPPLQGLA